MYMLWIIWLQYKLATNIFDTNTETSLKIIYSLFDCSLSYDVSPISCIMASFHSPYFLSYSIIISVYFLFYHSYFFQSFYFIITKALRFESLFLILAVNEIQLIILIFINITLFYRLKYNFIVYNEGIEMIDKGKCI